MKEIENFLQYSIKKNTGVLVNNENKSILEYDISPLELLYVIVEIEQKYHLCAKDIIYKTTPDSFTIVQLTKIICEKMVINA